MTNRTRNALAGTAAGLINGLFGGGGGMALLPLLTKGEALPPRKAFATCVAVILPLCALSAAIYWYQVRPALSTMLPYLIGGLLGGIMGGFTFEKVPVRWLKILFGLFMLYAGVRYLL